MFEVLLMTWIYLDVCLAIKHLGEFLVIKRIEAITVRITSHSATILHAKMTIDLIVRHHIIHHGTHSTGSHAHFVLIVI